MGRILITGATGHLGTAVINQLLRKTDAGNVVALARNEAKAAALKEKRVEVRSGTFDDTASLDLALQGIEKVLLISTADPNRYQQHKNVVDAAVRNGVRFIAYTSVSINDIDSAAAKPVLESHFQTEEYIKSAGIPYTFLRNNIYVDMVQVYAGAKVFENGVNLPAGEGRLPFALRREMGEGAANLLLRSKEFENTALDISNTELYSFSDVARILTELSGKPVSYTDVDTDEFKEALEGHKIPDPIIFIMTAFLADFKNNQYERTSTDLEELLGRKPAGLKEALKELYNL